MKKNSFAIFTSAAFSTLIISWPVTAPTPALDFFTTTAVPVAIVALVPVVLLLTLNLVISRNQSPRYFAVLAALTALAIVVRVFGAGVAGIEPIWAVVIISAIALGTEAGFIVGVGAIALSAIATGGVGPWLPYQMTVAGMVGVAAGLLHGSKVTNSRYLIAATGFGLSFFFGWMMNLWFWPTAIGLSEAIAFDPAADNLSRLSAWIRFNLLTSLGFDLPRAIITASILALVGSRLISTIQRSTRVGTLSPQNNLDTP